MGFWSDALLVAGGVALGIGAKSAYDQLTPEQVEEFKKKLGRGKKTVDNTIDVTKKTGKKAAKATKAAATEGVRSWREATYDYDQGDLLVPLENVDTMTEEELAEFVHNNNLEHNVDFSNLTSLTAKHGKLKVTLQKLAATKKRTRKAQKEKAEAFAKSQKPEVVEVEAVQMAPEDYL